MSETPTIQNTDEKSEQVRRNADAILADQNQRDEFFTNAEIQLGSERNTDREEKWNLYDPIEAFDPDAIIFDTPAYTPAPEYAAPKTRAQEIEEPLFYRTPAELVAYARNNTHSVITMRHAL